MNSSSSVLFRDYQYVIGKSAEYLSAGKKGLGFIEQLFRQNRIVGAARQSAHTVLINYLEGAVSE